jgi:hypothetical protein
MTATSLARLLGPNVAGFWDWPLYAACFLHCDAVCQCHSYLSYMFTFSLVCVLRKAPGENWMRKPIIPLLTSQGVHLGGRPLCGSMAAEHCRSETV